MISKENKNLCASEKLQFPLNHITEEVKNAVLHLWNKRIFIKITDNIVLFVSKNWKISKWDIVKGKFVINWNNEMLSKSIFWYIISTVFWELYELNNLDFYVKNKKLLLFLNKVNTYLEIINISYQQWKIIGIEFKYLIFNDYNNEIIEEWCIKI